VCHVTETDEIDEAELRKKWGAAVRQRRTELKISQAALAEAVGIAQQNISAIENGAYAGSTPTKIRIAKNLGVAHDDLFYDPRLAEGAAS
jgi:putative transcriptional regulator